MTKREFKDNIYSELARVTKAMANPHRLEIIELLAQGEYPVDQIAKQVHLPIANTSQHLQVLKQAQLVDIQREGNFIYYRLSNSNVFNAWKALRELGLEQIASLEKLVNNFRKSKFSVESITINQLVEKLEAGKITVLDVRPKTEYKQGHIANAISIPVEELSKRLKELPKKREIITYCRGPFCVFADEAAAILCRAGYKAYRLDEGYPDWKLHQLPIEISLN